MNLNEIPKWILNWLGSIGTSSMAESGTPRDEEQKIKASDEDEEGEGKRHFV